MNRWDVSVSKAAEIQKKLQASVRLDKLRALPRTIAGVDVSSNRFSDILYGGFVVLSFSEMREIERACATLKTEFPYVTGFLSFREIPVLLKAFEKLKAKPDLLIVDGRGIAHPRRLGIATHLEIALNIHSIGFAKSILYGKGKEPANEAGAFEYLLDPKTGEKIGAQVRTKTKCKPMIVSPGHRVTLDEAIEMCLATRGTYRIPEPTRRAHDVVNEFRRAHM